VRRNDKATSLQQLDLFEPIETPSSPLVGLRVELPRPCPKCGNNIGVIGGCGGPHANRITCDSCNIFRRWLGHREADFVAEVSAKFGCLSSPIILRAKEDVR
jgi:hypothetical protein